jgi:hypothetical protein
MALLRSRSGDNNLRPAGDFEEQDGPTLKPRFGKLLFVVTSNGQEVLRKIVVPLSLVLRTFRRIVKSSPCSL